MIVGVIVIVGDGGIVTGANTAPRPLPLSPLLLCVHSPPPVGNCPTAYLADCYIYFFVAPLLVKQAEATSFMMRRVLREDA
jgi:hypothetical protein